MPLLMPFAASTEMVKFVRWAFRLPTIVGRLSFSARSSVMGTQIRPRPANMKFTIFAVAN